MKTTLSLITLLIISCTLVLAQNENVLSKHSIEVQKIIKNEKGVLRGYDFGTPAKTIKETEDAKLESEGKDFLIYRVPIKGDKEYAEIVYTLDEAGNVKAFTVAFLENLNLSVEQQVIDDFQRYFTEKYGKFKTNDKNDEVWTSQDGKYTIEMGDASETGGDVMEIEIDFYPVK